MAQTLGETMSDDSQVMAEILRLQSAIDKHKSYGPVSGSYNAHRHAPNHIQRGAGRGRGYGRGQGPPASSSRWTSTAATRGRGSMKLVLNRPAPAAIPSGPSQVASSSTSVQPVASTSKAALQPPATTESSNTAPASSSKAPGEVDVNGAIFISDPTGRKLVSKQLPGATQPLEGALGTAGHFRLTSAAAAAAPTPTAATSVSDSTPRRASVAGINYVRTKTGNLVSVEVLRRYREQKAAKRDMAAKKARLMATVDAMKGRYAGRGGKRGRGRGRAMIPGRPPVIKQDKQCRFFAKTGTCRKGLTCPYRHDPQHVAICPRSLRRACPLSATACPLSHTPTAHNMPHCAHFPRCTKGSACPYTHVSVSPSAPVCKDFAELGWCGKGIECGEKHVRECKEFAETGTCSKVGCKLPHIIARGKPGAPADEEEEDTTSHAGVPGDEGDEKEAEEEDGGVIMFPQDFDDSVRTRPKKRKATAGKTRAVDDMKANEDFVMFASSDDDEDGDQDGEEDDDDSLSVDSDELEDMAEPEDASVADQDDASDDEEDDDPMIEQQLLGRRRGSPQ